MPGSWGIVNLGLASIFLGSICSPRLHLLVTILGRDVLAYPPFKQWVQTREQKPF
jgi:hypothetical protein